MKKKKKHKIDFGCKTKKCRYQHHSHHEKWAFPSAAQEMEDKSTVQDDRKPRWKMESTPKNK